MAEAPVNSGLPRRIRALAQERAFPGHAAGDPAAPDVSPAPGLQRRHLHVVNSGNVGESAGPQAATFGSATAPEARMQNGLPVRNTDPRAVAKRGHRPAEGRDAGFAGDPSAPHVAEASLQGVVPDVAHTSLPAATVRRFRPDPGDYAHERARHTPRHAAPDHQFPSRNEMDEARRLNKALHGIPVGSDERRRLPMDSGQAERLRLNHSLTEAYGEDNQVNISAPADRLAARHLRERIHRGNERFGPASPDSHQDATPPRGKHHREDMTHLNDPNGRLDDRRVLDRIHRSQVGMAGIPDSATEAGEEISARAATDRLQAETASTTPGAAASGLEVRTRHTINVDPSRPLSEQVINARADVAAGGAQAPSEEVAGVPRAAGVPDQTATIRAAIAKQAEILGLREDGTGISSDADARNQDSPSPAEQVTGTQNENRWGARLRHWGGKLRNTLRRGDRPSRKHIQK